jgi:hypothetical protein
MILLCVPPLHIALMIEHFFEVQGEGLQACHTSLPDSVVSLKPGRDHGSRIIVLKIKTRVRLESL